ncbi:family 43 glycosylhydrolase [Foetidibacter luteolus]|uniref:family 43 glycosylhydrolase n=1 Tax=Foetidibacter luteolus TaxID=2608880 RepID=UPI00129AA770|nr:family 43 glycosylhydrolase [Foetidibacter luteolus]
MKYLRLLPVIISVITGFASTAQDTITIIPKSHRAAAPLYRDPVTDGAADPVLIWNRQEKSWWMLYTQRRANSEGADVAYCYGTPIAVASSNDHGQTWVYRGTLKLDFENGLNTFWAPDVVYHNGEYHMFVVYIQGARNHWGGRARMAHYTSKNLWDWKFLGLLKLTSESVIDASLMQMPNGKWRMWYKDQERGSVTMMAESDDLYKWKTNEEPAIGGQPHEGPKAFKFGGWFWMLTDEWRGMRVYRSKDGDNWERQGLILDSATSRTEDGPSGAHGDVIVINNKAYVFYFTHPERKTHSDAPLDSSGNTPYRLRRSSIQVGPLQIKDGTLVSDRQNVFDFWMDNPEERK